MDEIFKNDESVNFSTSTFSSISKENIEPINLTVSDTHVAKNMVKNSSNEQLSASTSKSGSDSSNTSKTGPGKVKSSYYQQKKAFIDIGHQRNNIMKDHVDSLTTSQELYHEGLLTLKDLTTVKAEKNRILNSTKIMLNKKRTRIQERLLLRSRLMTLERLFQYESWYEMNRPDYENWAKIAENSGLIGKKSVSECWRHFCELNHTFKYHKGVSKRGEPIEPWEYYDTFNHYYHVCLDREDARWRAIRAARYAHAGDSD